MANDLVRAGLAEFTPNPDHRTSPLLTLTDVGHTVLEAINERAVLVNNRLAAALGPVTLHATREGIRQLIGEMKS